MINYILQKTNARLIFFVISETDFFKKKLLVMPLILCHFDYACSFLYMRLSKLLKQRLQVTQNKIIRIVLKMDQMSQVDFNEFKNLD